MLGEVLRTVTVSPRIERTLVVTQDVTATQIAKQFGADVIYDTAENGVNGAVALADRYLIKEKFDASVVIPQDIPYIKTQDIDFVMSHAMPPNFAIIVPSRRFDGTNALVRMPVDLMETRYNSGSYKSHMRAASEHTRNATLVFARRVMLDIDNYDDLMLVLSQREKPDVADKIAQIIGNG